MQLPIGSSSFTIFKHVCALKLNFYVQTRCLFMLKLDSCMIIRPILFIHEMECRDLSSEAQKISEYISYAQFDQISFFVILL